MLIIQLSGHISSFEIPFSFASSLKYCRMFSRFCRKIVYTPLTRLANASNGMLFSSAEFSTVPIKFHEEASGKTISVEADIGKTLLDVSIEYDIDIEGACGGEMACSTCHVVLSEKLYESLEEKTEEEEDMLDLAWGVTDTSRLGCQCKVDASYKDEIFIIPSATNNIFTPP